MSHANLFLLLLLTLETGNSSLHIIPKALLLLPLEMKRLMEEKH